MVSGSRGVWSEDEHGRFREALEHYPDGPWKAVAAFVGTRTVRQEQTHAQKYHEKAARQLRNLLSSRTRVAAPTARIDFEMQGICQSLYRHRVPLSPRSNNIRVGHKNVGTEMPSQNVPSFDECIDFLIDSLGASAAEWVNSDTFDSSSARSHNNSGSGSANDSS